MLVSLMVHCDSRQQQIVSNSLVFFLGNAVETFGDPVMASRHGFDFSCVSKL